MAAVECVVRDEAGDKGTLGEVLKRNQNLIPKPLDSALEKLWGYSSNYARHLTEGQEPSLRESELVVGVAAVIATYLSRKP